MLLGTMFTCTTYGTWLRGDARGWVADGVVFPPDPDLERADRERMNHEPFVFQRADLLRIGAMIGDSLTSRLRLPILALAANTWHFHLVTGSCGHRPPAIAKCAKEAVRYGLRPGRPIWTDGYDKRFCFDERTLQARIAYVERHNTALGWPAKPWPFIVGFSH
jgi:hypothetical protein